MVHLLRCFFCLLGCGSFHFVPCILPFLGALVFYDWQGFIIFFSFWFPFPFLSNYLLFHHIIALIVILIAPLVSYAPHTKYAFAPFFLFVLFWFVKQKQKQEGKQNKKIKIKKEMNFFLKMEKRQKNFFVIFFYFLNSKRRIFFFLFNSRRTIFFCFLFTNLFSLSFLKKKDFLEFLALVFQMFLFFKC